MFHFRFHGFELIPTIKRVGVVAGKKQGEQDYHEARFKMARSSTNQSRKVINLPAHKLKLGFELWATKCLLSMMDKIITL